LVLVASGAGIAGLAGCGGSSREETPDATGDHDEERPAGVSAETFEHGPVPEPYSEAASQAGELRDPTALTTKEASKFQEASDAVAAGLADTGETCETCAEYIPDENGDGFGACAKVEGYIGPEDWCALWESIEEHEAGG
jgi:hypothetical protein